MVLTHAGGGLRHTCGLARGFKRPPPAMPLPISLEDCFGEKYAFLDDNCTQNVHNTFTVVWMILRRNEKHPLVHVMSRHLRAP